MRNSDLRKILREKRKNLSLNFVAAASEKICKKILASADFRRAKNIAYYLSHENEVDLSYFSEQALREKKNLYLPVFSKPHFLHFYRVTEKTVFQKNQFGILEPISQEFISPDQIDLMLIPVVTFDESRHRLGRGLGCYDRYLAGATSCKKIGVAYEFQKTVYISAEKWDIEMDEIVTER